MKALNASIGHIVVLAGLLLCLLPGHTPWSVGVVAVGALLVGWATYLQTTSGDLSAKVDALQLANNTAVQGLYAQKQQLDALQVEVNKLLTEKGIIQSQIQMGLR